MAKSLVCQDCNVLLKSVKEAQDHNELTGHANFAESVVAIKTVVCTECGKPCRTDAEREMHTRFSKHTNFVDKTDECKTLDTEKEMKSAKADLMDETSDLEPGSSTGASGQNDEPEEMVPAVVDAVMLQELEAMGFSICKATRALHYAGNSTVEGAVNWLMEHEADADLEEPLLVSKAAAAKASAPKLSAEEARKKAEELMRKAKEKREKEQKEQERVRELDRIRSGKEMLAVKAKSDEGARKRIIEERQREKLEEQRAREKIKQKLEDDRRERRRKLGLPEELTEEEKKHEEEKLQAQQQSAEAKKGFTFVKPVTVIEKVRKLLVEMKKANTGPGEERYKTAVSTLLKYLGNIAANPGEEKYRSIKLGNAAFQQRVSSVEGSLAILELAGFTKVEEVLTMPPSSVNVDILNAVGGELNNALTNPFFGVL